MTTQIPWDEAILTVLRDADGPLDAREIAHRIEKNTLGATPETTVMAELSTMVKDGTVIRGEREVYQLNGIRHATAGPASAAEANHAVEQGHSQSYESGGSVRQTQRRGREIHRVTALGLLGMLVGFVFMAAGFIGLVMVDCPKFNVQFPPVGFACSLFLTLACIGTPMSLIGLTTAGVAEVAATWKD